MQKNIYFLLFLNLNQYLLDISALSVLSFTECSYRKSIKSLPKYVNKTSWILEAVTFPSTVTSLENCLQIVENLG